MTRCKSTILINDFKYIYRREYLQKIQAHFEEGIMHEDELWCPVVLYHAEKMVITDIEFYYYRQSEDSVMHTTHLFRRLKSLFKVTDHYLIAEAGLKKYTNWRMSDWVASVEYQIKSGKKVMLVFNTINGKDLLLNIEDVPADWVITTDRKYFRQAEAIVFHLSSLHHELEQDLDKLEGQTWVSWYVEAEKNDPLLNDPEINDIFDLAIIYRPNEEQREHPLVSLCRNM